MDSRVSATAFGLLRPGMTKWWGRRRRTGGVAAGYLAQYALNMTGYVYMLASQKRGTIYIGVTNSLGRRIPEHKAGVGSAFTARHGVHRLVWYEEHFDIRDAIQRETSLKRWRRQWKIDLIEKTNPEWNELLRGWGWD